MLSMEKIRPLVATPLVPFAFICFGPVLLLVAVFVPAVFLTAFLGPNGQFFILLGILGIVYPLFIVRVGYQHCLRSASWLNVGLKLYLYWLLLLAPLLFLLLNALGGTSMAVVEGTTTYEERLPIYLAHTAVLLLAGHILFIPWIFLSTFLVRFSTMKREAKKAAAVKAAAAQTTAVKAAAFLLASLLSLGSSISHAATLSERYGELLSGGDLLLTQDVSYFYMSEAANHASPAYEAVASQPEYLTLGTTLAFSLGDSAEMSVGHAQALPTDYRREIFDPAGALNTTQDYELNYMRDYALGGRGRVGRFEPYVSFLEKTQKVSWRAAVIPQLPSYFSYIRLHFEDAEAGVRFLSDGDGTGALSSNLSLLEGPLLDAGQVDADLRLSYNDGKLRRNVAYYFGGLISDNMYHDLKNQFMPGLRAAYGWSDGLEMTAGVAYAPPYSYIFEYRRLSGAGLAITHGDYEARHEMEFPLGLRWRPSENAEVLFASDIVYAQQRLDYWQRATTGVVTTYPTRKLKYLNTQPSVTLTYLWGRGKEIARDAFNRFTKTLLAKGQWLVKFHGKRDVTTLDKSAGNGAQNRIDPHNVFLYPLEYFVGGSEHATYFTGNTSTSAANVAPQNYSLFRFDALYGLTDRLSAGITVGYSTSSRFHHFTMGSSSAYDLQARNYVLKPYWFFGVPCDWRPTENSLVSLVWHYVPRCRSAMGVAGQAEDFDAKTEYHSVTVKVQILF